MRSHDGHSVDTVLHPARVARTCRHQMMNERSRPDITFVIRPRCGRFARAPHARTACLST